MKLGTRYELFVKEIYEAILRYEGVENINVQHDIKIKGSSGVERQVDIYWEFKTAGVKYRLIIEYKDYKTAVPLEKLMHFTLKFQILVALLAYLYLKMGISEVRLSWPKNMEFSFAKSEFPMIRIGTGIFGI